MTESDERQDGPPIFVIREEEINAVLPPMTPCGLRDLLLAGRSVST